MHDYSVDCYRYLSASKTPSKMNDKERATDDFQLRFQLKKTRLESENYIQNFCDTFTYSWKTFIAKIVDSS